MRTLASWILATLFSTFRGMNRHVWSVVTWKHTSAFSSSVAQTRADGAESYRVQVHDDFPRQRLHLPDHGVRVDAAWRQHEATQEPHLHEGHPSSAQAQILVQAAGATRRREAHTHTPQSGRGFQPVADAQVSSVEVRIKEFHAQVERLALMGVPPLPHRLSAPHVVEDVQLRGKTRQKKSHDAIRYLMYL